MTGHWFIHAAYLAVAVVFIFGLKAMASPATARKGIVWAGYAMVAAVIVTFFWPGMENRWLIVLGILLGGVVAWRSGKKVAMTEMPQMVAIYNGMGGGAAAAIAAVEFARGEVHGPAMLVMAVLGALIGAVAFSGSCVAWAKLAGKMKRAYRFPNQRTLNIVLGIIVGWLGLGIIVDGSPWAIAIVLFFVVALVLGVVLTAPIGGADMPVVISLLNAFTGLAVGFEGYVLQIPALIVAGIVVGASGTLLTHLMAKAMNRPIRNVLFTPLTGEAQEDAQAIEGRMQETTALDAAATMRYAAKVIVVPGYGMAVAGAQHKVWEMSQLLEEAGVSVSY